MKVASLLIFALLVSSSYAATLSVLTALCPSPCDLSTVLALTGGLNAGSLTTADTLSITTTTSYDFSFSKAITVGSIALNGASGTTLTFAAGTASTLAGALQVAANNAVTVAGTLTVAGQSLVDTGALIVNGAATFNGGINFNFTSGGSSSANQGLTVNNGGSITFGADSSIATSTGISFVTGSLVTIKAGTLTVARSFQCNGQMVIASTLALTATSYTYTQSGANLFLQGASTAVINANTALTGSTNLTGQGTINGNLNVGSGSLRIGNSPGTLFVNGDINMDSSSRIDFETQGDNDYDKIICTGNVKADGNVICHLLNNYNPAPGTSYAYITTTKTASGSFFSTLGDSFGTLTKWRSNIQSKSVNFVFNSAATATASFVLIAVALLFSL